ncbi:HigA family addiction module antitoxin, partial [Escherichia sp. TWPC-MK]
SVSNRLAVEGAISIALANSRRLTGKAALTPEMAIKLSVVIGSSPQMWLNLQNAWSLAEAEKTVDVSRLRRLVTQ